MEKLTRRQKDILDYVKKFVVKNGYAPTVREIGEGMNLSSPATIHAHLTHLINKGYLGKASSKNRTLEILVDNEYAKKEEKVSDIPLLGKITAGSPIEAIEQPNELFSIPSFLIPKQKEVFALKVSGESMINAGIHDGDIVIVERCSIARNGQIVVAMNNENEVTLKTFYKEATCFRLQPENDTMEPIYLDDVTILGRAVGLYRKI